MKYFGLFFPVMLLAVFAGHANAQELLDDPGLNAGTNDSAVTNSDWQLVTNDPINSGLAKDRSAIYKAAGFARSDGAAGSGAGIWFKAFFGNQGGDTNIPTADARLFQEVLAPSDGDYVLTFEAAREADFVVQSDTVWEASLTSDGTGGMDSVDLARSLLIPPGNFNQVLTDTDMDPNTNIPTFTLTLNGVTAGDMLTVSVDLVNGRDNFPVGGSMSAFVDNFSLTRIPEPSSVMLMGLGVVGLVSRRRR